MGAPRLSIGIPTVERLHYLREAVASAQSQRCPDLEILIADDGDSRELSGWAHDAAARDDRVRYLKTPGHVGLAGAWNYLADAAAGDWLTIIGDDDRLLPEFAARLLREATSDVAVVFSNHYVIDASGRRLADASLALTHQYARDTLAPGRLPDQATVVWGNSVPMSSCIVRTRDVRRLRFKSDLNTPELELFARLSLERSAFVFVPDYLAEYRSHAASETARGLTLDRLAEYLEAIDVPADIEPAKRGCLEAIVPAGVGVRLARGDVPGARKLHDSRYYTGGLTVLAQRLSLGLPDSLAPRAYRSFRRLAHVGRGLRRRAAAR